MPPLKKSRWERFAQNVFLGKTALESYILAGYSKKNAGGGSSLLLDNPKIAARISELHEMTASAKIMTVSERKERLSEIARARYVDFVTAGPDGSWIDIGPEKIGSAAIAAVRSKTEYDENGDNPAIIMTVKLHNPLLAIAELNKMEGAYAPIKTELTGKDGAPIELIAKGGNLVDLSKVPDTEIDRAIAEVERILQGV